MNKYSNQEGVSHQFAKAAALRGEIADIYRLTKSFMGLVAVPAAQISVLVDRAERVGLVDRAGMVLSGLDFVRGEKKHLNDDRAVSSDIGMPTVMHIHREARRAMNVLNNEGGYRPRRNRLYGPFIEWTPLIP